MSLFVIADLHLSLSVDKPMNIFPGWDNHIERLQKNWQENVSPDDTVVIPGDISWALNFEEAMNRFLEDNGFDTISILHNNHFSYGEYGICGTRGWINDNGEPADAKVLAREAGRLEASIKSALSDGKNPIVFLHYPPIFANDRNREILAVMYKYDINKCYYGHLHGNAHRFAVCGEADGINFQLISADFVQFCPKFIM